MMPVRASLARHVRGYAVRNSPLRKGPPRPPPKPKMSLVDKVWQAAVGFSAVVAVGAAGTIIWQREKFSVDNEEAIMRVDHATRHAAYNSKADIYDDEIGFSEVVMGLLLMRRWLMSKAEGKVLEVAVGTGRNFPYYYRASVSELHCVDVSRPMLERCKERAKAHRGISYKFLEGSAEALPVKDNEYDTVVDTFGMCSFDSPVAAIREMMRVCKPGGKVLLLEHGKPQEEGKISQMLGRASAKHAKEWGCWWNRNILRIIEVAGMQPKDCSISRYHFDTTKVIIWTKPLE